MEKGFLRDILSIVFFLIMVLGVIFSAIAGFSFTGWYTINHGLDGVAEAIKQKEYVDVIRYSIPLLFVKLFSFSAGFVGLILGWIPGYVGLVWLERNDKVEYP